MKPESRAASKINFYNTDSHVCHKKTQQTDTSPGEISEYISDILE